MGQVKVSSKTGVEALAVVTALFLSGNAILKKGVSMANKSGGSHGTQELL